MADAEEIARDIVVALVADNDAALRELSRNGDPAAVGRALGELYLGVLEKLRQGSEAGETPPGASPAGPAGGHLAGSYPNPSIADGVVTAAKLAPVPATDVSRIRSNQSIPDDVETAVVYNGNLYDTAGIHPDTFNGDSRFTAPVDGLYLVRASVRWAAGGPGNRLLKLRVNGGTNETTHEFAPGGVGSLPRVHSVSKGILMRAGDFVEAVVKQTSGGDLEIALGVDTEFSMCWVASVPLPLPQRQLSNASGE